MKKATLYLLVFVMSMSFIPQTALGASVESTLLPNGDPKEVPVEVKAQLDRLNEIKAMDKSKMTAAEKKALRKEVKAIKTSLRDGNGGIYLSVGAIIIIILLLILLL
ncbi:hypothetical protein [Flavobacterium sp.]|uniref:hypothetical protein n=1 Tax=Flavobacterium sp. TaxID=239 RepID=UPI002FDE1534